MKTKAITFLAATTLWPLTNFAQAPSTPPVPPVPPVPPSHPAQNDHDRTPKPPVTFLGLETSPIPGVVCDQLGLAKGFGLVVDYVVPDSPAAQAGVQQNDILKLLNDQILMEPNQLAKLVRSFPEGTSITLTVLRKGAETKLTAKLAKHESANHSNFFGPDFNKARKSGDDLGLNLNMDEMTRNLRDMTQNITSSHVNESIREAVRQARREAVRAREEAKRAAPEMHVVSREDGEMKSTRIDLRKAEIVLSDAQGELKIDHVAGKKILTAKDPQGRLVFSGPVETKEDVDKLPPEVRARYEKIEQRDLPTIGAGKTTALQKDQDSVNDSDADDDDDDDDDDASGATTGVQTTANAPQARLRPATFHQMTHPGWDVTSILF